MTDDNRIKELVSRLTLEEKASLTAGKDAWFTKNIDRLGIPSVHMTDGPHGLRMVEGDQDSLEGDTKKAVSFPSESTLASSFSRELVYEVGKELGRQARAYGVQILLGPGVNMKRSPLCGRNFEYFSEDPYLAGELASAYIKGVQSEGVGTSLKHFFANNQEFRRNDISSELDERTMREIYLYAFEKAVKEASPLTVMASYNRVNGTFSTENRDAIEGILRNEWGFDGIVISDWGATHDRGKAVIGGTDLTMPYEKDDVELVKAVKEGRVKEEDLDRSVERLLKTVFKVIESKREEEPDLRRAEEMSMRAAAESMVLLKNEGGILPINRGMKIALIGAFAKAPRFQGGGSSHINVTGVISVTDAFKAEGMDFSYSEGYHINGDTDDILIKEACEAAGKADIAVVFAGLTDEMETEGTDRIHMKMPKGHDRLIREVSKANGNTAVVLFNGSPVEMPWIDSPKAVLEAYLGGQTVGQAVTDILLGKRNPSGHLAETFPLKLAHNPSYLSFRGEGSKVSYQEGIYTGYRYYETKEMDVLFPFGYGLSYTDFSYSGLELSGDVITKEDELTVTVKVTNTGKMAGSALVQLYVAPPRDGEIKRPVRELKGFERTKELMPGESETLSMKLTWRDFSHWNTVYRDWKVEKGEYGIEIGINAHDIVLKDTVRFDAPGLIPQGGFTEGMPMSMLADIAMGREFLDRNIGYMVRGMAAMGFVPKEMLQVMEGLPGGITLGNIETIGRISGRGQGAGGMTGIDALLAQPLAILMSFLPEDGKEELKALISQLNCENGV